MTLKQILTFDVTRVLLFDVNRILFWDVRRFLTTPIRNPLLKAACGWIVGTMVLALAAMVIGKEPSRAVAMLILVTFAAGAAASHLPAAYRWCRTPRGS